MDRYSHNTSHPGGTFYPHPVASNTGSKAWRDFSEQHYIELVPSARNVDNRQMVSDGCQNLGPGNEGRYIVLVPHVHDVDHRPSTPHGLNQSYKSEVDSEASSHTTTNSSSSSQDDHIPLWKQKTQCRAKFQEHRAQRLAEYQKQLQVARHGVSQFNLLQSGSLIAPHAPQQNKVVSADDNPGKATVTTQACVYEAPYQSHQSTVDIANNDPEKTTVDTQNVKHLKTEAPTRPNKFYSNTRDAPGADDIKSHHSKTSHHKTGHYISGGDSDNDIGDTDLEEYVLLESVNEDELNDFVIVTA